MADYTSSYTGAQIDSAVGKALAIESTPANIDAAVTLAGDVCDHVVASSLTTATGAWNYIKFDSGACVLWGQHAITPSGSTASGSGYYSDTVTITTPFGVAYAVLSGMVDDRYMLCNPGSSFNDKTVSFRLWRGSAVTTTQVMARVIVFGKWK